MAARSRSEEVILHRTSMGVIISYKNRPKLQDCLRRTRAVANSYAGEFVKRIYKYFIEDTLDLRKEYTEYYKPEYRDIYSFLYYKYACSDEDIRSLKPDFDANRFVFLVVRFVHFDDNTRGFLAFDEIAAKILGAIWEDKK